MDNKEPEQDIDDNLWYFETKLGRGGPYMTPSIAWAWYWKTLMRIGDEEDACQSMVEECARDV